MLPHAELASIKEKFEITQKLLIKVDKELEQQKVNKNTDSGKFMEIINKAFQTYELCAQEFCFELELLQLSFVSVFFKQYMQSYHKFINNFLKFSVDKISTNAAIQRIHTKANISDSSRESSPDNTNHNDKNSNMKVNLMEKFQKIDQMTKVQMELNNKKSQKEDLGINMLPLTGKPAGVDNNSHKDRKSYTIQLLRIEMLNLQTKNQSLSKTLDETSRKNAETELAKKNLEEEIIKLVKLEKMQQNDQTKMMLSDKNRIGGGYDNSKKNSQLQENGGSKMIFKENNDIDQYLKNIESKKKPEIKKEIDVVYELIRQEKEKEKLIAENPENKQEMDELNELNELLQKRELTFSNIKDSGAAKELKQYLRKMNTRKKEFSKISLELLTEFDEISDTESPSININKGDKKSIIVKKPHESRKSEMISPGFSANLKHFKPLTKDKATMPDPMIFDIAIIDAMKFTIQKLKAQLKEDEELYKKEIKRLEDEIKRIKPYQNDSKLSVEISSLKASYDYDMNKMKEELNEFENKKNLLEKKIQAKKAKIKFLKNELSSSSANNNNTNNKDQNIMIKFSRTDNQDNDRLKIEIKLLKSHVDELTLEIERLKKELGIKDEDYKYMKEDYEEATSLYNKLKAGFNTCSQQISLLKDKNIMLESLVVQFEEGKKKLDELKNSDEFKKNTDMFQIFQEEVQIASKNINKTPLKRNTPKKNADLSINLKINKENSSGSIDLSKQDITNKSSSRNANTIENANSNSKNVKMNKKNERFNVVEEVSEKPQKYNEFKIKNLSISKQQNSSNNRTIKPSSFRQIDEIKGNIEIENAESYNLERDDKNSKLDTKKEDKIIKNLQNRLQNEIIQKEQILQEKLMLEQKFEMIQKEGLISKDMQNKFTSLVKIKPNNSSIYKEEKLDSAYLNDIIPDKHNKTNNLNPKLNESFNNANSINYVLNKIINKEQDFPTKGNIGSDQLLKNILLKNSDHQENDSSSNPYHVNDSNKNIKTENKYIDPNTKKYHIDNKKYSLNYNKSTLNKESYKSQEILNKPEKYQSQSREDLISFVSEEIINNPSLASLNSNDININNSNQVINRREQEKKKEDEKINIMYENLKDIITLEGENLLKHEDPELSKLFQKIINKEKAKITENANNRNENVELSMGIDDFREVINEIKNEHKRCGNKCIHLRRFYEKLGFSEKKICKKIYHLHTRNINKLPKIN